MNLLFCLRRAKQFHGSKIACYRQEVPITWSEFYDRAHRAAAFLRDLGIKRGDRAAVWLLNSYEFLELYYATVIAGIVIVPLNTRWHENDVAFAVRDSDAVALIADDRFAAQAATIPRVRTRIFAGHQACPAGMTPYSQSDTQHRFEEPDPDDIAGLFYTSGTTGGPKGVMLTHQNLWVNMLHTMVAHQATGPFLHAAPMFHLADLNAVFSTTSLGFAHSFLESFHPEVFMQVVDRHKVHGTVLVPAMLNMILNHPSFGRYDLSSLTMVMYGASPMPLPLIREAMAKLPHVKFLQGYGMTETSPLLTVLDPEDHIEPTVMSAGRPVLGVEVKVVDFNDREVPVGETGEIVARGANIMKGYWKRPEITAEVLRGGWMHTGDIGRFDANGYLYILDRKKDMIKPGSENVYSPEVESMILGHPAVLEVAVIGVPDEKWGEAIRAIVAPRDFMTVTETELIAWCRERMAHFKCPSSVIFVETLPKGGTGKVQKNVLRERYGRVSYLSPLPSTT